MQCELQTMLNEFMYVVQKFQKRTGKINVNSISDAPVCSSQMVDQLIGVTADENISINCRVSWKKCWPLQKVQMWYTFACSYTMSGILNT